MNAKACAHYFRFPVTYLYPVQYTANLKDLKLGDENVFQIRKKKTKTQKHNLLYKQNYAVWLYYIDVSLLNREFFVL